MHWYLIFPMLAFVDNFVHHLGVSAYIYLLSQRQLQRGKFLLIFKFCFCNKLSSVAPATRSFYIPVLCVVLPQSGLTEGVTICSTCLSESSLVAYSYQWRMYFIPSSNLRFRALCNSLGTFLSLCLVFCNISCVINSILQWLFDTAILSKSHCMHHFRSFDCRLPYRKQESEEASRCFSWDNILIYAFSLQFTWATLMALTSGTTMFLQVVGYFVGCARRNNDW